MVWTLEDTGTEQWAMDWDVIARIHSSYALSNLKLEYSQPVKEYQGEGFFEKMQLPAIHSLSVDWETIKDERAEMTLAALRHLQNLANQEKFSEIQRDLFDTVAETHAMNDEFNAKFTAIQTANANSIERHVTLHGIAGDIATLLRNRSLDAFMVLATAASGGTLGPITLSARGASFALTSAGGIGKGLIKYQDTGKVGSAYITGAGEIAVSALKLKSVKDHTIILCKGAIETGSSLLAGDDFLRAIRKGAVKIGAETIGKMLTPEIAKSLGNKWLPFNLGPEASATIRKNAVKKVITVGTKGINSFSSAEIFRDAEMQRKQSGLLADTSWSSMALVELAMTNMAVGFGRRD